MYASFIAGDHMPKRYERPAENATGRDEANVTYLFILGK
jgi:hypothetical protein